MTDLIPKNSAKMKAAVFNRYGGPEVIEIKEVEVPQLGPSEVLVQMHSSCVNSADSRMRSLNVPTGFKLILRMINGPFKPKKKILGVDGSGTVVSIGQKVTKFKLGDRVLVSPGIAMGCHAELLKISESGIIARIPDHVSLTDAAASAFGGTTALLILRDQVKLKPKEKIMIIGATGTVGSAAVQLARHYGAHVTAVCSGQNEELALRIGASEVIDYQKVDLSSLKQKFDIVMDCVGKVPLSELRNLSQKHGRIVLVVAGLPQMLEGAARGFIGGPKIMSGNTFKLNAKTLSEVLSFVEAGIFRPVIDRILPLETIRDAHVLVDSGHKKGSVVIQFGSV